MLNAISNLFLGRPIHVGLFYDHKVHRQIRSLIREINPCCIYCQLIRMSPYVMHHHKFKVIDFMDSFELNFRSLKKSYLGVMYLEYLLTKRWEARMNDTFNACA